MPRGSVEILSCFGGKHNPAKGGSMPMRIRVLESRYQPGHVNILMNKEEDPDWIRVVEAYDVDARDLLKALELAGVVNSYTLAPRLRMHVLRLEGNTLVVDGCERSFEGLQEAYDKKIELADRHYRNHGSAKR
jgi:hypothetical protein